MQLIFLDFTFWQKISTLAIRNRFIVLFILMTSRKLLVINSILLVKDNNPSNDDYTQDTLKIFWRP